MNFPLVCVSIRRRPSSFHASGGPSNKFCELSVHPQDIPSTSDNIPCVRGTFCELPVPSWVRPSTSVKYLCVRKTICQLPTTFHASAGLHVYFCHLSTCSRVRSSTFVNFSCIRGAFIDFRQLCFVYFRQQSIHPQDLP